ncbi:leucine-rich repeat protein [Psychrobacillus sp. FSL H8-0510]|uniref:leucine-rich repeat protein n=1 Tax=Psychrobacillus sp. FSL H8-0510 TaxID=2921394 RepID=UPI0030F89996
MQNKNMRKSSEKMVKGVLALSLILSGSISTGLIGVDKLAYAAEMSSLKENPVTDFKYTTHSGTKEVTITDYLGVGTDVVIPAYIQGNPVAYIGNSAFKGNNLKSVILPEGIKTIASNAFQNNLLTSVNLPNKLTKIELNAFENNQLETILLPSSLTTLGNYVFKNNKLKSVDIPNSIISMGLEVFSNNKITNVTFKKDVKYGSGTFLNNNIKSVSFEDGVTTIGNSMFEKNQITSVDIPASVRTIGSRTFSENLLTKVKLPEGVTSIGSSSFNMNQIREFHVPSTVSTFLVSVLALNATVPADVKVYGYENPTYAKSWATKDKHTWVSLGESYVPDAPEISANFNYTIANGEVTITEYTGLVKNVWIPDMIEGLPVVHIGNSAFKRIQLTGVTLPSTLKTIGSDAFSYNLLTSVKLPEKIVSVDQRAFQNNLIHSVNFPESLKKLGDHSFGGNAITEVKLTTKMTELGVSVFSANNITKVEIEEGVTRIPSSTFTGNKLSDITLPSSLKTIEYMAFNNNLLSVVKIPDNVNEIGSMAFGNNDIHSITMPYSLTSVLSTSILQANSVSVSNVTVYGHDTPEFAKNWANTIGYKFVSLGTYVDWKSVTDSVVKAENTKLQVDVTMASTLVNTLPSGAEKTNLLNRLSVIQKAIDDAIALANQIAIATASVMKAEDSKAQVDVTSARTLVNALSNDSVKTSLISRLDTVQAEINLTAEIARATTSVVKAEGSKLQTDVDRSRLLVNNLSSGAEKTSLTNRLNMVQKAIDDAKALAGQIATAAVSVEKAEESKLQADIDAARSLVIALPSVSEKNALTVRLDSIVVTSDGAELVKEAQDTVDKLNDESTKEQIATAKELVAKLPDSSTKMELSDRITSIELNIKAINAVVQAEKMQTNYNITLAEKSINQLSDGPLKTELSERIEQLKLTLEAESKVKSAELTKSDSDIMNALDSINKLKDSPKKTELLNRIKVIQDALAAEVEEALLEEATTLVVLAEQHKRDPYLTSAKDFVAKLQDGADKTALEIRLQVIIEAVPTTPQDPALDPALLKAAEQQVTFAERYKRDPYLTRAQEAIDKLPSSEAKTAFQERLNFLLNG